MIGKTLCLIAATGAALFSTAALAEEHSLTLDDALIRALAENRDIAVAKARIEELKGMEGEARSMGLPQLSLQGQYQHYWEKPAMNINGQSIAIGSDHTYSAQATATQLLWDGGRVFKAIKAAKSEEARGEEGVRATENQIAFQTNQLYYEILYLGRVHEVLARQLKQLKSHLGSIQQRFNAGIDSDYTLMRQSVEVSNLQPELIDVERRRELATNSLKLLLAIPPADTISLKGTFDYRARALPKIEELIEKAKSTRPDLSAERFREKSLIQNIGAERASYSPTLSLSANYGWQGQTNDWKVGSEEGHKSLLSTATLSWPIFDGFKTSSRVRQAKARLIEQRASTSELEDSVAKDVQDAYFTIRKMREALAAQRESLSLAKKASAIASERFNQGLMSQLEMNDTITAEARAQQLYLRSAYDCLIAEAALDQAVGGER